MVVATASILTKKQRSDSDIQYNCMLLVHVRLLRIEFVLEPSRIKTCMCVELQFIANFFYSSCFSLIRSVALESLKKLFKSHKKFAGVA